MAGGIVVPGSRSSPGSRAAGANRFAGSAGGLVCGGFRQVSCITVRGSVSLRLLQPFAVKWLRARQEEAVAMQEPPRPLVAPREGA